jgi:hypothetical protein
MTSEHFSIDSTPGASSRTLKIEEEGDFSEKRVKPKIRLMGRWLEKAGFRPGGRVHVVCRAPGIIELRIPDTLNSGEAKTIKWEQANLALGCCGEAQRGTEWSTPEWQD